VSSAFLLVRAFVPECLLQELLPEVLRWLLHTALDAPQVLLLRGDALHADGRMLGCL
jgi:hypothetical protein